ncbi:DNA-methyltransferase [Amycolatopsis sp. NPDC059657]|uniref:DNA-methyltransferase n=1 Tax=Amycolatopsis sp. NPDC059657 TaxID=3346899 RepID=UPI00366D4045
MIDRFLRRRVACTPDSPGSATGALAGVGRARPAPSHPVPTTTSSNPVTQNEPATACSGGTKIMASSQHQAYYRDDSVTLHSGDAATVLATLPTGSAHCVVTSPPYWGLRDYETATWSGGDPACSHTREEQRLRYPDASVEPIPQSAFTCGWCGARREDLQHGLELTPGEYVDRLREVMAQVHRVLVDTGTLWLNLGDSYSASPPGRTADPMRTSGLTSRMTAGHMRESVRSAGVRRDHVVPRKNLVGIPWTVAFALQRDGWILRNAIVWHKPNAMPEPVRDRLSSRYELLFLLTKQRKYDFDLDAIREPLARPNAVRKIGAATGQQRGKNPGDVWSIPTRPLREAHFAAFPIDIPLRCVAAGCPENGTVLDPFSGAGTTGLAARRLGRHYVGIDLNPEFHAIALRRLDLPAQQTDRNAA